MTRRTPALVLLAAAATVALAACGHPSGTAASGQRSPARAGLGANGTDPSAEDASDQTVDDGPAATPTRTSTARPTPSTSTSTSTGTGGPTILSFTATGAVCPVDPKPDAPYSQPGKVTISWKISGADGADLFLDSGLWNSYSGTNGSSTLPFQCPDKTKPNTHTFTLKLKGHASVSKTISATAKPNP